MNYTVADEGDKRPCLRRLAASTAALPGPACASAAARRRAPTLAGAVSRIAPHRAGPTDPDGLPGRDARLRRVECDGVGGPPGVARSRAPAPVGRRPPGESIGSDTKRFAAPRAPARSHDHAARQPETSLAPRPADTGTNPHAAHSVSVDGFVAQIIAYPRRCSATAASACRVMRLA